MGIDSSAHGIFRAFRLPRLNADGVEPMNASADRRCPDQAPTPIQCCPTLVPTRLALEPAGFAAEFIRWLQGPHGRTGAVAVAELYALKREMALALDIEDMPWNAIAPHLRRLLGDRKRIVERGGKRYRTYHVPPLQRIPQPSIEAAAA